MSVDVSSDFVVTAGGQEYYPKLFSEFKLRNQAIKNRLVMPPLCATWVNNGIDGVFQDLAVDYYAERAKGGMGLIMIGAVHVHPSSISAPLMTGQLFDDRNIEPLSRIAHEVHKYGCKLGIQLYHSGCRGASGPKKEPLYDEDATWHTVSSSQLGLGEFPGGEIPKELTGDEVEEILDAYASAAGRAIAAGLDGVEFHLSHGYLGWQFLSPLYNKRTDKWGGSYENRLRFPTEAMQRMRKAIGNEAFMGYRINSTSFWPNDLEVDDVTTIVADLEKVTDTDYVSVSAGVHHSFIHTPMHFEGGWERPYARAIKSATPKPVWLVGRITTPEVAEEALQANDGDFILLGRQMFADPEWAIKAATGRADDIRPCVAANHCWRQVSQGARVQCIYNPTMGREGKWGAGTLLQVEKPKNVLVVGAGPAGLEYARVAAARGHRVTVLDREDEAGGHVTVRAKLARRGEFQGISNYLENQAVKNGAELVLRTYVNPDNLEALVEKYRPDHVVVATGSSVNADGFNALTGEPIPGHSQHNVVTWDSVVKGRVRPTGKIVVFDDVCDYVAPLLAAELAEKGNDVTLMTRWPMIGMDTMLDVYLDWLLPRCYETGVKMVTDHFISKIEGNKVHAFNVHAEKLTAEFDADWVILYTGRRSENELVGLFQEMDISVEAIGDAVAPRTAFEATYEGHRQARKL